jgi:hypothetical protein
MGAGSVGYHTKPGGKPSTILSNPRHYCHLVETIEESNKIPYKLQVLFDRNVESFWGGFSIP